MDRIQMDRDGLTLTALIGGDGPLVVLMHGFPDTHESWSNQWERLVKAGYRCLVPVMRGYETGSARAEVAHYATEQIVDDVMAWLDQLNVGAAHIVGHDWGAVNAYLVATTYPRRVLSLTTLAIPHVSGIRAGIKRHPIQIINSSYMLLFQWRGLAEWIVSRRDFAFIDYLWRRWSPNLSSSRDDTLRVKQALRQPGVLTATLNYYRALFSSRHRPSQKVMSRTLEVPTLMIAGETDACMNVGLYDYIDPTFFADEWQIERLPIAGHFMQLEAPDQVSDLIVRWLQRHPSADRTGAQERLSVSAE
ncbi:MAG: alpha/beta fold hydrolase [Cellvibrionaceae bacterium]